MKAALRSGALPLFICHLPDAESRRSHVILWLWLEWLGGGARKLVRRISVARFRIFYAAHDFSRCKSHHKARRQAAWQGLCSTSTGGFWFSIVLINVTSE